MSRFFNSARSFTTSAVAFVLACAGVNAQDSSESTKSACDPMSCATVVGLASFFVVACVGCCYYRRTMGRAEEYEAYRANRRAPV